MRRLDTAIEGSPRTRFFLELFGNSAIFPIANAVLELLLEDGFAYFRDPDFYALMLAAVVQARFLARDAGGPRRAFVGNLVGPAVYTTIETAIEGSRFFTAPHHIAYWGFGLAIGALQQVRHDAPPRYRSALLVAENVVRSSILFTMYAIFEVLTAPAGKDPVRTFFDDPSHVFIAWSVTLLGVVAGLSALTSGRYLAMLRDVSRQLRVYSEWFFGRPLLEQAMGDPSRLALARRERAIVFMDVRGFTRWSEGQPPEAVVEALNAYYVAAEAAFERHVPVRFKFNADEVMAVFADAPEAVTAARDLAEAAAKALAPHGLGAGIGVHFGPVVEGVMGAREVKAYDVLGDTVNTAKRIEGAAAAGEILLSDAAAARAGLHGAATRSIAAKGKSAPLEVTVA
ncbi:MAG: adenylate/guanylate cyclase domain-containing protein [Betaproteobacteria bacterium]